MFPDDLHPQKLIDIVFRMEEYISVMRSLESVTDEEATEFATNLEESIVLHFDSERIDLAVLKKETLEMINELYIQIMELEMRDTYVDMYFDIVLGSLFYEIGKQGIHVFFILENELEDDRYMLVKELFELMLFKVVVPHEDRELLPDQVTTRLPSREYYKVEETLKDILKNEEHCLYLEKDTTTSYMHRILDITERDIPHYICLYRNKPISTSKAIWIKGKSKVEIG